MYPYHELGSTKLMLHYLCLRMVGTTTVQHTRCDNIDPTSTTGWYPKIALYHKDSLGLYNFELHTKV